MGNEKFKVGDTVRIIKASSIEPYELNKIGTIVKIVDVYDDGSQFTHIVDMGRPRRSSEPEETCWWLRGEMIELAPKPKEQLLFNFMNEF